MGQHRCETSEASSLAFSKGLQVSFTLSPQKVLKIQQQMLLRRNVRCCLGSSLKSQVSAGVS